MAARSRVSVGPGQLALPDPQAARLVEVERELTMAAETLAQADHIVEATKKVKEGADNG